MWVYFYIWCEKGVEFYSFEGLDSFPRIIYWRNSFPHCPLCCRLINYINVGLFSELSILFQRSVCLLVPEVFSFDYCSFVAHFGIWECDTYSFVLLSQDCFVIWGLSCFHTNFRTICSTSVKTWLWYFDRDYIESEHCLGWCDRFNNTNSSDL